MPKILIVIVVLIILVLGFHFFAPDSMKFWKGQTAAPITAITPNQSPHERITAKHQFKNGTHIIAGEVDMPTPCYILTTEARVAESMPEQVTIDFVAQTSGEMCAQVITPDRFKSEFKASQQAVIKATWNGQPVELNLIPVGADEDLINFEIFIKG